MKPVCCGKNSTPYRKDYGRGGWEEGFRCRKCGRIRIPFEPPINLSFMATLDAFREEAVEFWKGIDFDLTFPALITKRKQT